MFIKSLSWIKEMLICLFICFFVHWLPNGPRKQKRKCTSGEGWGNIFPRPLLSFIKK